LKWLKEIVQKQVPWPASISKKKTDLTLWKMNCWKPILVKDINPEFQARGVIAEVETLFEPIDKGTLITLKWTGRAKATPLNLFLYLLRRRIKREATSELIEFKTLVETYGVKFS